MPGPNRRLIEAMRVFAEWNDAGRPGTTEEFLARHGDLRELLAPLVGEGPAHASGQAAMGEIGPYRLIEVLGEGGMGTVYLAEQTEPIERRVALKVIKLGMDSESVLARFEAERQALALMNHIHVARVLDTGTTPDGRPYFTMDHVAGLPITEACDGLDVEQRLELFCQVCDGVQHAHGKGLIHRDLKPSNILVHEVDGSRVAKIIDFGIAKALTQQLTDRTLHTQRGQAIGTPVYMSPEQIRPTPDGVDTRSDIYALGVVLYELLSESLPFTSKGLAFDELQHVICEREPKPPSAHSSLMQGVRGGRELDWITLRCLAKEPDRRYAAVSELGADLRRYLADEPVLAVPPSTSYRFVKLIKRRRATVAAVLLLALGLVALFATTSVSVSRMRSARELAEGNARKMSERAREATQKAKAAATSFRRFETLANVVELKNALQSIDVPLHPFSDARVHIMEAWLEQSGEPLARGLPAVEKRLSELAAARRPDGAFRERVDEFLHDQVRDHVLALQAFSGENGRLQQVRDLLHDAKLEREVTIERHRLGWLRAIAAIAESSRYGGLRIDPQYGLVPIGPNPASGLWEFSHPRSGNVCKRGSDGRLELSARTGLVFVLVPGGQCSIGAQNREPNGPNYDPLAQPDESPVHEVKLEPFFVAKHEMTCGQWLRLTWGRVPARKAFAVPGRMRLLDDKAASSWNSAVTNMTWHRCEQVLATHGLLLPTEAQWEYVARAGTTTPWWIGTVATIDRGVLAAIEKRYGKASNQFAGASWAGPPFESIDAREPNPFGLYGVHGGVTEWCRDWYRQSYAADATRRDGRGGRRAERVFRSGAFRYERSAKRFSVSPDEPDSRRGVRPTRALLVDAVEVRR